MIVVMMMLMSVLLIFVIMMVMFMRLRQLREIDPDPFDGIEDLLRPEFPRGCSDNCGIRIQGAEKCISFTDFLFISFLRICPAENNRTGRLHLVFKEFAEVLQVHFALQHVDNGRCRINDNAGLIFHFFDGMDHI